MLATLPARCASSLWRRARAGAVRHHLCPRVCSSQQGLSRPPWPSAAAPPWQGKEYTFANYSAESAARREQALRKCPPNGDADEYLEQEYWRIVECQTEEQHVDYANDLDTRRRAAAAVHYWREDFASFALLGQGQTQPARRLPPGLGAVFSPSGQASRPAR